MKIADKQPSPGEVATEPRLLFENIIDRKWLTIQRARSTKPAPGPLVVVFNSLKPKGAAPDYIGTLARMGRPVLYLQEHDYGFYATHERVSLMRPIVEAEMRALGCDCIDTMGFSIGGYGAVSWGELLPVRHVMAFAPRFSPDPAIFPDPRIRGKMNHHSGKLRLPTIEPGLRNVQQGMILHGLCDPDSKHVPHFPSMLNVDHWVAPLADHYTAGWLRKKGKMEDVIIAVLNGERDKANVIMQRLPAWRATSPIIRISGLALGHPVVWNTRARLKRSARRIRDQLKKVECLSGKKS